MRQSVVSLFVVLALLVVAAPSRADVAHAKELYAKARTAYNLADYSAALALFKQGYTEHSDPEFLFNIAQCQRALGKHDEAALSYRAYLREVQDGLTSERIRDVKLLIGAMETAALQQRMQGGEPRAAVPAPAPATLPTVSAPERPQRKWYRSPIGWSLVGVGAAAAIVGGVLLAHGQSLDDGSRSAAQLQTHYDLHAQAGTYETAGIAMLGSAGAVLVGAGAAFALEHRREHGSAIRVGFAPSAGGAFLSVGGQL